LLDTFFDAKTDFDKEGMGVKIQDNLRETQNVVKHLSSFKGEFIAVHDPFINKNLLTFKVENLKKYTD
jgi:hypothetical protein